MSDEYLRQLEQAVLSAEWWLADPEIAKRKDPRGNRIRLIFAAAQQVREHKGMTFTESTPVEPVEPDDEPPAKPALGRKLIRWEPPTYSPDSLISDGPWGRYLIRREKKGGHDFIGRHNGAPTKFRGTRDQVRALIERVIHQRFPDYGEAAP